jgi:predicted ArsR family transcriptional regulator
VTGHSLTDRPGEIAIGSRRRMVLSVLREADGPLSVADVATRTGLHINTARFHLDSLVADGTADRRAEERDIPGRPRVLYTAHEDQSGPRSYRLLAEMLTGLVGSLNDAELAAEEAGRAWGRHLVERVAPSARVDRDEAVGRLSQVLDRMGFEPEALPGRSRGDVEIRLHHCPFVEVARSHGDVVCALHRGVIQGALAELHAPIESTALEPFVTPTMCVARLRATSRSQDVQRGI